jgi:hypothetical protein
MEEPRNTKKKLGGEDGCGNEMWKWEMGGICLELCPGAGFHISTTTILSTTTAKHTVHFTLFNKSYIVNAIILICSGPSKFQININTH